MRLLIVTDNRFYRSEDGHYDVGPIDRQFFNDYQAVFDEIKVAGRVTNEAVPAGARRADGDGVEIIPMPDIRGARWATGLPARTCGELREAIKWADAVCIRVPAFCSAAARRWAKKYGKPVMFEMIGDPELALSMQNHGVMAWAAGQMLTRRTRSVIRSCVVGSYVNKNQLHRRFPTSRGTRSQGISDVRLPANWLLPARNNKQALATLRVVLVAALIPVKRQDTLIRGVAEAISRGASVHLTLVGDGEQRAAFESLVDELGIRQHVTFAGHVSSRPKLLEILDKSDLFCMTSITEGMPRAMLEAMARGLPAIGTDATGINELLTREQLVPIGDHARLGELFARLQQQPELLNKFARQSEHTVRDFREEALSERRQALLMNLRQIALSRTQRERVPARSSLSRLADLLPRALGWGFGRRAGAH